MNAGATKKSMVSKLPMLAVAGAAAGAASQAGAAVVYIPMDASFSSAGPTSVTTKNPTIGIAVEDAKNNFTFTASATNGITAVKPSTSPYVAVNALAATENGTLNFTKFLAGAQIGDYGPATGANVATTTGTPINVISADGTVGNFGVSSDVSYIGWYYPANSIYHYGWIGIQVTSVGSTVSGKITGIALESEGNLPIVAGSLTSIPEPGTMGMLAAGVAGLGLKRRRSSWVA